MALKKRKERRWTRSELVAILGEPSQENLTEEGEIRRKGLSVLLMGADLSTSSRTKKWSLHWDCFGADESSENYLRLLQTVVAAQEAGRGDVLPMLRAMELLTLANEVLMCHAVQESGEITDAWLVYAACLKHKVHLQEQS